jgi:spore coat polysaccharide biosynthesis predicted glycosyltransferase SpsG
MGYVFRADASPLIGAGHVMRVAALAEEVISRGHDAYFIGLIEDIPWLDQYINKLGFRQTFDVEKNFNLETSALTLILDSYLISIDEDFIQKKNWRHILGIYDYATPMYDVHTKVHSGLDDSWIDKGDPNFLNGVDFVILRRGIIPVSLKINQTQSPKILVVGGGTDPFGFSPRIHEELMNFDYPLSPIFISDKDFVEWPYEQGGVLPFGQDLDALSNEIDMVITTASTMSLEFIARRIPTACACVVSNQLENYMKLAELKLAQPIGLREDNGTWKLDVDAILEFISDLELRKELVHNSVDLIDLKGTKRIIDYLDSKMNKVNLWRKESR